MKKFIENLTNIWKIEELKNRIILTLGVLLVYRFGAHIVLPGIDSAQLHELASRTSGGGLLGRFPMLLYLHWGLCLTYRLRLLYS